MTMSTFVTPPPPTRNALPPAQRIRLMRSTRKLAEILGADPHVLEDDAKSSISSSSISSTSTSSSTSLTRHSASSSVTSLSSDDEPSFTIPSNTSTKKSKSHIPRTQPLFLKLNVKSHHRKASLDSASPISPISPFNSYDLQTPTQTSQAPPDQSNLRSKLRTRRGSATSISWDFGAAGGVGVLNGAGSLGRSASISSVSSSIAAISEARIRRKRMAKLKRTLGENVPVELVFGHPPSAVISKPKPPPVPSMSTTTIRVRPPTPPKIRLPVSPPPRLPELDVVGEERLDPFNDAESPFSPSDVLVIGPTATSERPISTMTTASVYSQPSAGLEESFPEFIPTSTPKAATDKPSRPPRAEPRQSTILKEGSVANLRRKARSLNFHQRPHPLSLRSPPPPMPSPFTDQSFLSFSPSTPVPPTPIAVSRTLNGTTAVDAEEAQFTPRAGSHSLDLPSAYRRSQWENMPSTPGYHTAAEDVLSLGIPAFGRRKEREWSGEWNKPDMTDVLKGLRGLKAN